MIFPPDPINDPDRPDRFRLEPDQRGFEIVQARRTVIHTTRNGTQIFVEPGRKSRYDFRVRYQESGKRVRTPKHIHIVVDLYMKKVGNGKLTMQLVDHLITVSDSLSPINFFPPRLQRLTSQAIRRFSPLDKFGEYSVEFLLAVTELIMLQEVINYPSGTLNLNLFQLFRKNADIFSVVEAATFRGN